MNMIAAPQWSKTDAKEFWSELKPASHLVQVYEKEDTLLDALEGFVCSGLENGESVVLIATKDHVEQLGVRLSNRRFDLIKKYRNKQLIILEAEEILSQFMVVGWPDENRFNNIIGHILAQAKGPRNRKVRAFGEMVAVLWSKGYSGATIQLENLWNKCCEKEGLSLFCAYPKSGFRQDIHQSIGHICSCHRQVISGEHTSKAEVFHQDLNSLSAS